MRAILLISLLGLSACKQSYSLYSEYYYIERKESDGPDLLQSFYGENAFESCVRGKVLYNTCINYKELEKKGSTKIVFDCYKKQRLDYGYINQLTCKKEYGFIF